jgi:hypothetical protein
MHLSEMQVSPGVAEPRLTFADIMMAIPRICSPLCSVLETIVVIRDEDRGAVTVVVESTPGGVAERPASDLRGRGVRPVRSDDPFDVVKEKFGDPQVRRLVVIDSGNEVIGIIARADLAPQLPWEDVGEGIERVVDRAPSLERKGGSGTW